MADPPAAEAGPRQRVGDSTRLDGHRLSKAEGRVTTAYTYYRADQLIDQTIGTTVTAFAYDGFGTLTSSASAASSSTA